jgi:TPR repeat protein
MLRIEKEKCRAGTAADQKNNSPASSGSYNRALKLAQSGKFDSKRVARLLERVCAEGDLRAAYALATWYLFGHAGYLRDLKMAVKLLRMAAEGHVPAAHFDLAVCYETGRGTRKNEAIAYRHYLAAALYGDNEAFREVGRCLYHGIGVARDRKAAAVWLDRAEEK